MTAARAELQTLACAGNLLWKGFFEPLSLKSIFDGIDPVKSITNVRFDTADPQVIVTCTVSLLGPRQLGILCFLSNAFDSFSLASNLSSYSEASLFCVAIHLALETHSTAACYVLYLIY